MATRFQKTVFLTLSSIVFLAEARGAEKPLSFEVYGFAMVDYIQDFKRVDPAWDATLRPSKIPTLPGQYGSDGQAILSPRQSRLGVQGSVPLSGSDMFAKVEFDFFGVGADAGKITPRLRHAYGSWRDWLGGQTHSLFMDIDVFPNVIDYWGPAGMVFLRTPQIRYTPISGADSFAVAIEHPSDDIDAGQIRDFDPTLGANLQADEKLPDLTAQYRANRSWGHLQIAGILRRVGFDTAGNADNFPNGHKVGWGIDVSSQIKCGNQDKFYLSGVFGQGIASYMNDGGTDLAPDGAPGALSPKAVPLWGVMGYFEHSWSKLFASNIGYARTQVDNTTFQSASAFKIGQYASANFLYTPDKDILMGFEFLWGRRTDKGGGAGDDFRTQISFKYAFSSKSLAQSHGIKPGSQQE
jgi:hypothetical protein